MTAFLVVQITQQAVMNISLKIEFPKLVLASITMSSGGRLRFRFTAVADLQGMPGMHRHTLRSQKLLRYIYVYF